MTDKLKEALLGAGYGDVGTADMIKLLAENKALQSKLDKAVEALDAVANSQIINKDALKSSCIQRSMTRKALKEIKGEQV